MDDNNMFIFINVSYKFDGKKKGANPAKFLWAEITENKRSPVDNIILSAFEFELRNIEPAYAYKLQHRLIGGTGHGCGKQYEQRFRLDVTQIVTNYSADHCVILIEDRDRCGARVQNVRKRIFNFLIFFLCLTRDSRDTIRSSHYDV